MLFSMGFPKVKSCSVNFEISIERMKYNFFLLRHVSPFLIVWKD
jgi:hypothetical protein